MNLSQYPRRGAFTLIELITVVAIVVLLAALLLPVFSSMSLRARVAQSTANLRQIGAAFQMHAGGFNGEIPAVSSTLNNTDGNWQDSDPWWSQCLTRYVGGKTHPRRWEIPENPFTDPVYRAIVGADKSPGWRGGYSMNRRLNLVRGEAFGQWNSESSQNKRYRLANIRGDSPLIGMAYFEGFAPDNDGNVPDERLGMAPLTHNVPHTKRIGANKQGLGGKSALYLFADGSVKNLTPEEAKPFLKLRN